MTRRINSLMSLSVSLETSVDPLVAAPTRNEKNPADDGKSSTGTGEDLQSQHTPATNTTVGTNAPALASDMDVQDPKAKQPTFEQPMNTDVKPAADGNNPTMAPTVTSNPTNSADDANPINNGEGPITRAQPGDGKPSTESALDPVAIAEVAANAAATAAVTVMTQAAETAAVVEPVVEPAVAVVEPAVPAVAEPAAADAGAATDPLAADPLAAGADAGVDAGAAGTDPGLVDPGADAGAAAAAEPTPAEAAGTAAQQAADMIANAGDNAPAVADAVSQVAAAGAEAGAQTAEGGAAAAEVAADGNTTAVEAGDAGQAAADGDGAPTTGGEGDDDEDDDLDEVDELDDAEEELNASAEALALRLVTFENLAGIVENSLATGGLSNDAAAILDVTANALMETEPEDPDHVDISVESYEYGDRAICTSRSLRSLQTTQEALAQEYTITQEGLLDIFKTKESVYSKELGEIRSSISSIGSGSGKIEDGKVSIGAAAGYLSTGNGDITAGNISGGLKALAKIITDYTAEISASTAAVRKGVSGVSGTGEDKDLDFDKAVAVLRNSAPARPSFNDVIGGSVQVTSQKTTGWELDITKLTSSADIKAASANDAAAIKSAALELCTAVSKWIDLRGEFADAADSSPRAKAMAVATGWSFIWTFLIPGIGGYFTLLSENQRKRYYSFLMGGDASAQLRKYKSALDTADELVEHALRVLNAAVKAATKIAAAGK